MRRSLFITIMEYMCASNRYFVQKRDACGSVGLSSYQKAIVALSMFAHGICANARINTVVLARARLCNV